MSNQNTSPAAILLLVQQLQQELQNQRSEIQSLRSDLDASRANNQNQRLDIQTLQSELQHLQNRLSTQSILRSRLPDPPRFDGKPYTLRTWLPSIRAKLRADQLTGANAFEYVWDRLEQPQQASVLHLRQSSEDSDEWNVEAIFSFFQRLYHNPREQQEAVQRFSSIRQKDEESLIAYLARFERLTYEAEATSWPDLSRITILHRGLRPALRQSLEESTDSLFSQSYNAYIELAQSLDRRTRPQNQKPAHRPEPMDIDHIQLSTLNIPRRSPSPTLSASSSQIRQYREKYDQCFYCGASDHWINICPIKPSSPTSPQPRSQPQRSRTKLTARSSHLDAIRAAAARS
ncbi:pol-like protein [Paraphaeosphaeria sporulosa]